MSEDYKYNPGCDEEYGMARLVNGKVETTTTQSNNRRPRAFAIGAILVGLFVAAVFAAAFFALIIIFT